MPHRLGWVELGIARGGLLVVKQVEVWRVLKMEWVPEFGMVLVLGC